MKHQAFAFIKPHAMHSQAVAVVIQDIFEKHAVQMRLGPKLTGPELASRGLIDRHFERHALGATFSVAGKDEATVRLEDLLDTSRFKEEFETDWSAAVAAGQVVGADQFLREFPHYDPISLCDAWAQVGAIELGEGLYVAYFEKEQRYVLNGFYPVIRERYHAKEASVQLLELTFEQDWDYFLTEVIGAEKPAEAFENSIRGYLYDRADALEMVIDPNDNILHVSTDPAATRREKAIWMAGATDPQMEQP